MSTFLERIQRVTNSESLLLLLELRSSDFPDTICLVADTQDRVSNGQVYLACPFGWKPPEADGSTAPQMTLTIANADRRISEELERLTATSKVVATIKVTDTYDPDEIHYSFPYPIARIQIDQTQATATAGVDPITRQQSVRRIANPFVLPGIF